MFEELLDPILHKHLHWIGVDIYHLQRLQPKMKIIVVRNPRLMIIDMIVHITEV